MDSCLDWLAGGLVCLIAVCLIAFRLLGCWFSTFFHNETADSHGDVTGKREGGKEIEDVAAPEESSDGDYDSSENLHMRPLIRADRILFPAMDILYRSFPQSPPAARFSCSGNQPLDRVTASKPALLLSFRSASISFNTFSLFKILALRSM